MDWARAVERNSEALGDIVATLAALLDTACGTTRIPSPLHRALLRVLHPAEAALRRLIVIAARGLVVKLAASRPKPAQPIARKGQGRWSFRLFDPRKSLGLERPAIGPRQIPRIHMFGSDPRIVA